MRQEHLTGLGETAALRGAVQEPGAQLLLQAPDLAAQGRLGDAQGLGGASEVQVLGDHGEVAHEAQIEIGALPSGRRGGWWGGRLCGRRVGHVPSVIG